MTTPTKKPADDRKGGGVVKLTAVANPAPQAPWPTQAEIKDLAETLDEMYPHAKAMADVWKRLYRPQDDLNRKWIIKEVEKIIENFQSGGFCTLGITIRKDGYLTKLVAKSEPENWSDDNCNVHYSEVARMITILMGSFPTAKIPEPEIFVQVLMDDIMALNPSFVEMESTCRVLRKTQKFMPSVSEVVEELEKQKKLWDRRWDGYYWIGNYYELLCAEIAKAKAVEAVPPAPMIEHRQEVPTSPWDKGVRASDVPIASHTVETVPTRKEEPDDEF